MNEAEKQNLIMQQYRLYTEQKDRFIDRSFGVNRFYIALVVVLMILLNVSKAIMFVYDLSLPLVFAIIGMIICILWWMNMDSYNLLIKIKFSKVIEEIEKQLPIQPYGMEHDAIEEYKEKKKCFLFSNMQKVFAIIMFIAFFVAFITELIPSILKSFI